jgi:hypothetical protein
MENLGFHSTVNRLQDVLVREVRSTLYLLWGGAAFVFLNGVVNVLNLALVRARFGDPAGSGCFARNDRAPDDR